MNSDQWNEECLPAEALSQREGGMNEEYEFQRCITALVNE